MPRRARQVRQSAPRHAARRGRKFSWPSEKIPRVLAARRTEKTPLAVDSRGRVIALVGVMIEIRRILCPVDFSEPSLRALQQASTLARWYQSALTALYVDTALPVGGGGDVGA